MNKSKFLKKSLAMLLALMLVVAMIPLSASAALPDDLEFIKVNDASYSVEELKVQTKDLSADVKIGLVADLTEGWTLRAKATSGSLYNEVSEGTMKLDPAQYMTVNGRTGTITLQLVNTTTEPDTVAKTYTLTVEEVDAFTTTNIELVDTGKGVYSAEIDNEKGVVKVVLARDNEALSSKDGREDLQDDDMGAEITVKGLQNATVENKGVVGVDAEDTFVVTAEKPDIKRTFRVEVVSYLDAFRSFSVDGVKGQFVDINRNNINDGIVVTLPKSALTDELGDYDNTFEVEYEAEGDLHCTVDIDLENGVDATNVESGDIVTFDGLTLPSDNDKGNDTVKGTVKVTRLGGAVQYYNLTVQLEDDTDTAITYVRVDKTEAQGWEDGAITVELPKKVDGKDTVLGSTKVTVYTKDTVDHVVIDNEDMQKPLANDPEWRNVKEGETAWVLTGVDLDGKQQIITVYAENVTETAQYTLTATKAERNDDAKLNSFYLQDGNGNSYGGEVKGKELVIEVPYMTLDVSDWTITYATSNGAKLQAYAWNNNWIDVTKGVTAGIDVGLTDVDLNNGAGPLKVKAIDKNDATIFEDYTIKVVLDKDIDTENTITNLRFTAQPTTELPYKDDNGNNEGAPRSAKSFWRAIDRDVNEFGTEVVTTTSQQNKVQNINIPVAPSLMSNDECNYTNVITEIAPVGDTQLFIRYRGHGANPHKYYPISVLTENWSDAPVDEVATVLESGDEIVAMPMDVARWALVQTLVESEKGNYTTEAGEIDLGKALDDYIYANNKNVSEFCTIYSVEITRDEYSSENTLSSFEIDGKALTVDNKTNTISGELAWGSTVEGPMPKDWQTNESEVEKVAAANAKFAEFELDKYAVLAHEADKNTVYFYSNGDIDGDGEEDDVRNAQLLNKILTNRKFVFVRNPDHTVSVYRSDGEQVYDEIKTLTVLAEDRLDDKKPSKNVYTLDLTWAEPETEADILTFKLDGFTGTIDDSDPMNRTITVKNVPYGTDVTGMIAEFTTTPNAKVYLTIPTASCWRAA